MTAIYTNKRFNVKLTDEEYAIFTKCIHIFKEAFVKDLAYVSGRGSIVFTPTALLSHGRFYELSEQLREHNPNGYNFLRHILFNEFNKDTGGQVP